jgi:hypothetical protein
LAGILLGAILGSAVTAQTRVGGFEHKRQIDPINDYDTSWIRTQDIATPRGGFLGALFYRCEGTELEIFVASYSYLNDTNVRAVIRFDKQPPTYFGFGTEQKWNISTSGTAAFVPLEFINRFVQRSRSAKTLVVRLERYDENTVTHTFNLTDFPKAFARLGCAKTHEAAINGLIAYRRLQATLPANRPPAPPPNPPSPPNPPPAPPAPTTSASTSRFINPDVPMISVREFTQASEAVLVTGINSYNLSYAGLTLTLRTGSTTAALSDGTDVELEDSPVIVAGTLLMPASGLQAFGCQTDVLQDHPESVFVTCKLENSEGQTEPFEYTLKRY